MWKEWHNFRNLYFATPNEITNSVDEHTDERLMENFTTEGSDCQYTNPWSISAP